MKHPSIEPFASEVSLAAREKPINTEESSGADAGDSTISPGPVDLDLADLSGSISDVFGDRSVLAEKYHRLLKDQAILRGLVGPREADRLWVRHIFNSAAIADNFTAGDSVVDIGSGAGLPGIPLAIARPDISVTLVEPLLRRTSFLDEVVAELSIDVNVVRGRAEDSAIIDEVHNADVVTARAVAPLAKLGIWSAPILRPGGWLRVLKGTTAEEELERDRKVLENLGFSDFRVSEVGTSIKAAGTMLVSAQMSTRVKKSRRDKNRSRRRQ